MKYIHSCCKLGLAFERLIFILIISGLCCHILTCIWITTNYFESLTIDDRSWADGHPNSELYQISLYFTITTMTSVGYGDVIS